MAAPVRSYRFAPEVLAMQAERRVTDKTAQYREYQREYARRPEVITRKREQKKRWALANRDRINERREARRQRNPERYRAELRHDNLRRLYGIGMKEYLALLDAQCGVCAVCQRPEHHVRKDGRLQSLSVDHDHGTGAIRGLLCQSCNRALGLFDDDADRLISAAMYLRR